MKQDVWPHQGLPLHCRTHGNKYLDKSLEKEYEKTKKLRTSTTLGSDCRQVDAHCRSRSFIVRKAMSIPTNTNELLPATAKGSTG